MPGTSMNFNLVTFVAHILLVYVASMTDWLTAVRGQHLFQKPLVAAAADLNAMPMSSKMRECEVHMPEMIEKRTGFFLCGTWWFQRFPTRSKRIDVISRIFFPLAFAVFNLGYWTTYLFRDDDVKE